MYTFTIHCFYIIHVRIRCGRKINVHTYIRYYAATIHRSNDARSREIRSGGAMARALYHTCIGNNNNVQTDTDWSEKGAVMLW